MTEEQNKGLNKGLEGLGDTWPEQEIVSAWLMKYGIVVPFPAQYELQNQLTALRAEPATDAVLEEALRGWTEWMGTECSRDWRADEARIAEIRALKGKGASQGDEDG